MDGPFASDQKLTTFCTVLSSLECDAGITNDSDPGKALEAFLRKLQLRCPFSNTEIQLHASKKNCSRQIHAVLST